MYIQDAHNLLSQEGLALKLWFCKRVLDVGGLCIVVMDYIEHKPCDRLGETETLRGHYSGLSSHDQADIPLHLGLRQARLAHQSRVQTSTRHAGSSCTRLDTHLHAIEWSPYAN